MPDKNAQGLTYYQLLEVEPGCSLQELRRAYREKSKVYHPDTTMLPIDLARDRFDRLKEAYVTLTNPQDRLRYDRHLQTQRMGRSSTLGQELLSKSAEFNHGLETRPYRERPLSPGEIFALFILGLTFVGCLVLAVIVGFSRGDWMLQALHYFSS